MSIVLIVPTLNSYKILPKLIKSLKKQTFENWQLIFVDGNSSKVHKNWLHEQCIKDIRFSYFDQVNNNLGIFGAMAEGIDKVNEDDWILFWGSDDWAPTNDTFQKISSILKNMQNKNIEADLLIFNGKYINEKGNKIRKSNFSLFHTFRLSLFAGSIPAHQATIFRAELLQKKISFRTNYKLASDLDIFLRMSKIKNLKIKTFDFDIVNISPGGISKRLFKSKMSEVIRAYKFSFGIFWLIPFSIRYFKKFISFI